MNTSLFSFTSKALGDTTLTVVRFKGRESLSTPYRLNITLMGGDRLPDLDACINAPATLWLNMQGDRYPIHGRITHFEVLQQSDRHIFYAVRLHASLWLLSLTCASTVYLNKTIPQCIQEALESQGVASGQDFEFKLQQQYPKRELVVQYNESHLNFITRWMEHEGLYYYFEQGESREKIIITDTKVAHTAMADETSLRYQEVSGLQQQAASQIVTHFSVASNMTPQAVLLKDYNYRTPKLGIEHRATVSEHGKGLYYLYAENPKTPSEAEHLATIRAQALACEAQVAKGQSGSAFVRSGWLFTLQGHEREAWNQEWCVTSSRLEGSQEGYIFSEAAADEKDDGFFYRVTFTAIPAAVQFRPSEKSLWPRIDGAMNAHIDAAGSGQYAELDEHGRYKITMPLDLSGRKDGHGSNWLRRAQPYGGSQHGMHFPLHKGVEAMLTFIDGDPDRPVIAGAGNDPLHESQVTNKSQTTCRITTGGQNKLHVEDQAGSQRMLMSTPTAQTYARMGAHNDPPPDWSDSEEMAGWKLNTSKLFSVQAGSKNSVILGNMFKNVGGWEHRQTFGLRTNTVLGGNFGVFIAYRKELAPFKSAIHALGVRMGIEKTKLVEEKMEAAEHVFKAAQNENKLAQSEVKTMQSEVKLAQNTTRLAQQKTELAQSKSALAQQKTALAQDATELAQDENRLSMEDVNLVQSRTVMAQSHVLMCATKTSVAETRSQLVATKTELAESIQQMATEKTIVAAEQNDT